MTNRSFKRKPVRCRDHLQPKLSDLPASLIRDLHRCDVIAPTHPDRVMASGTVYLLFAKKWRLIADLRLPNELLKAHLNAGPTPPIRQYNVYMLARGPPPLPFLSSGT